MEIDIIQHKIYEVRGCRVMLDSDLAELYGIETKVLKQAVRRNLERFPSDFMFELSREEYNSLRSQIVTLKNEVEASARGKHSKFLPFAFTEQGVAMLSGVIKSESAVKMNIAIMRAFVEMRRMIAGYKELSDRIEELEISTDAQFSEIYQALTELLSKPKNTPRPRIGYVK